MKRELGSGGIELKGKRTHGHGQQCGDCWGERGVRGLNGYGKNIIKAFVTNKNIKYIYSLTIFNWVVFIIEL